MSEKRNEPDRSEYWEGDGASLDAMDNVESEADRVEIETAVLYTLSYMLKDKTQNQVEPVDSASNAFTGRDGRKVGKTSTSEGNKNIQLPAEVVSRILYFASFQDLLTMRAASIECRMLGNEAILDRVCESVHDFIDPKPLLDVMEETGAVISGSLVLRLISDKAFTPNDIDLYVSRAGCNVLLEFLVGEEYFEVGCREVYAPEYGGHFIKHVYRLERKDDNGTKKMNVVVTNSRSPLMAVFDFDNSLVFNIITGRTLISAYARLTMKGIGAFAQIPPAPQTSRVQKYIGRGFRFLDNPVGGTTKASEDELRFLYSARSLNDRLSLSLTFRPKGRDRDSLFKKEVEDIRWRIRNRSYARGRAHFVYNRTTAEGVIMNEAV
ncbi:hypothetical protein NP233_g2001 [Leucocoprinus birnbaumii]|uniref:F-box domain-containing protein n=1 Tax=Leucocoprinus birnbaumii TaxID=56174 RepID=A0AAD5W313_9AGAR|nr:hypothetical protein NP233_g2001 [Leucocoprinus birnbaumii]